MKSTQRLLLAALFGTLTSAGLLAQTTTTPTTPTTPPGSAATGTTNSGGVAPANGKPSSTPTGNTDSTGSGVGLKPTTPVVGGNTTTTTSNNTTTGPGKSGKGPNEHASETAKAVHEVIATFQADRETYLADRKKMLEDLKKATTEEERKKVLEDLRKARQERETEERSLGKQIRDELKGLRDARKSGGT